MDMLIRFLKDDKGATIIEYAMMITFIALACIAAVTLLGTSVSGIFSNAELTGALK